MAQWDRSIRSAIVHSETLFVFAARDYTMNVDGRDLADVRDNILQIPNMNTTGRLPTMLLVHIKMQVRITVPDERLAAHAPVDTTGTVQNIELHPTDRARLLQLPSEANFVLHHAPTILVQIDDNDTNTGLGPGIVAVESVTCQPFTIELELEEGQVFQSTLVESESRQRANTFDNCYSVDHLHFTRLYGHAWADLPFSHTSPH